MILFSSAVLLAWLIFWQIIFWPALMEVMSAHIFGSLFRGDSYHGMSRVYVKLTEFSWFLTKSIWPIPLLQILAFVGLFLFSFEALRKEKGPLFPVVLTFIYFMISTAVPHTLIRLTRDPLHALLLVLITLIIPYFKLYPEKAARAGWLGAAGLGFLLAVVCELRFDSFYLLLLYPAAFAVFKIWPFKKTAIMAAVAVLSYFIVAVYGWQSALVDKNYRLISTFNNVAYFFNQGYRTQDLEGDKKAISLICDAKMLEADQDEFGDRAFVDGCMRENYTAEDTEIYMKTYRKMIRENLGSYLVHRLRVFLATMAITDGTKFYGDMILPHELVNLGYTDPEAAYEIRRLQFFRSGLSERMDAWPAKTLGSLLPLLLYFFILARFRDAPFCALAAALNLPRFLILYLMAPAANYTYGFSFAILPFFLFAFERIESLRTQLQTK